ncbi:MAG: protein YgfX [Pseudomonadota bacterium]
MSSRGYAAPLRIEVTGNRLLRRLYLVLVALATVVLLWLSVRQPLLFLSLPLFLWLARREWLCRAELAGAPITLLWDVEQCWWAERDGEGRPLQLQGESFLSPVLVVLRFRRLPGRRRDAVVLTPGAVGEASFRRLLVRLRLEGREALG